MTTKVKGVLEVKCCGGRDLMVVQKIGKQDPFLQFEYNATAHRIRADNNGGQKPVWNEVVSLNIVEGREKLGIQCYDENLRSHVLIGESVLELKRILEEYTHDAWFPLTNKGTPSGEIYLEFTYYPADGSHKHFGNANKSTSTTKPPSVPQVQPKSSDLGTISPNMVKAQQNIKIDNASLYNNGPPAPLKSQAISNSGDSQGVHPGLDLVSNMASLHMKSPTESSTLQSNSLASSSAQKTTGLDLGNNSTPSKKTSPPIFDAPVLQNSPPVFYGPSKCAASPPSSVKTSPNATASNTTASPIGLNLTFGSEPTISNGTQMPGWGGIESYMPVHTDSFGGGFGGIAMPDAYTQFPTPFDEPLNFPAGAGNQTHENLGMPMPMPDKYFEEQSSAPNYNLPRHGASVFPTPAFPTPDLKDVYGKRQ